MTWTPFESSQELKAHVARAPTQAMLDRGEQFGLRLDEVEPLLALVKAEEEEEKKRQAGPSPGNRAGRRDPGPGSVTNLDFWVVKGVA